MTVRRQLAPPPKASEFVDNRFTPPMATHNDEKTSTTDDLAVRSDDDLFDILTHIDRRVAAERYVAARDEFARRHGPHDQGPKPRRLFRSRPPESPLRREIHLQKENAHRSG